MSGLTATQGGSRLLIKGAWVITLDTDLGDLPRGDVLIVGSKIAAVGRSLDVADAEIIDGTDRIVIPGFVDTHRHLWQTQLRGIAADWTLMQYLSTILGHVAPAFTPEDTYAGNLLGVLEGLDAGITTMVDWSHALNTPAHADAAFDALADSGARAVLAHGNTSAIWGAPDAVADWSDLARLQNERANSDDQLVTLAVAARGPDYANMDVTVADWKAARDLGLRVTLHAGAGAFTQRPVATLNERGLLGPDVTYAHCCRLHDDEVQMIADTGGSVSIATEVEMHMGHGYPPLAKLWGAGIRPSLSIDVCTGIGGDMFTAMRATLAAQRAMENEDHLNHGTDPERLELTSRDVLQFATIDGARACGFDSKIGSITPGKEADLVLLRTDVLNLHPVNNPVAQVALAASTVNVDTVLVGGRVVKREGHLVDVDVARVRRLADESRDRLIAAVPGARVGGDWTPNTRFAVAEA
ncbi:MAG: 5-methylthioadenosine/S-adenosylhomocysteine deaminase [Solirubrobacteraceae bacterium]|jgi:cytosine/adenosine deaminase-related metal-dependent hydrolase|nr:5-methylthioadenosine/S-adenosylhomocysteine deaminase [Solirubrobacteraceae bacterium]